MPTAAEAVVALDSPFDRAKLERPYKQGVGYKPDGFWYAIDRAWLDWCEAKDFDCSSNHVYVLDIDYRRVLRLRSVDDILTFNRHYGARSRTHNFIDWARVAADYAGIEIAPYQYSLRMDRRVGWYYTWDVASGCVWDPSVILGAREIDESAIPSTAEEDGGRFSAMNRNAPDVPFYETTGTPGVWRAHAQEHEANDFPTKLGAIQAAHAAGARWIAPGTAPSDDGRGYGDDFFRKNTFGMYEVAYSFYARGKWHLTPWEKYGSSLPPDSQTITRSISARYGREDAPVVYDPPPAAAEDLKWRQVSKNAWQARTPEATFTVLAPLGGRGMGKTVAPLQVETRLPGVKDYTRWFATQDEAKREAARIASTYAVTRDFREPAASDFSADESPSAAAPCPASSKKHFGRLRWKRGAKGSYSAQGIRGLYEVVRVKPNRRAGINPWLVNFNGTTVKSFDTVDEAKTFAQACDTILSDPTLTGEYNKLRVAGVAREARESIPFEHVERNPVQVARGKKFGKIGSAREVYDLLAPQLAKSSQEVFLVLPLNLHSELLCAPVEIARGQKDRVSVGIEDVLRPVIAHNATSFYVVHNHPSGHASKPSKADADLTNDIIKAAKVALPDTEFVSHVIIGDGEYYDFASRKAYRVK